MTSKTYWKRLVQRRSTRGTALILFVDELQYVPEEQLAALITALHRAAQRRLPVALVGAGLPQLRGRMGKAKSYAERLFEFPEVGPLSKPAAKTAIAKPAAALKVKYEESALDLILKRTQCYAYFLQEWGKHAWDTMATLHSQCRFSMNSCAE